jgi:Protein of unknown function (DUF1553)/Protein of unknown function (DUF1549)/Planctomycete cytochrome C
MPPKRKRMHRSCLLIAVLLGLLPPALPAAESASPASAEFFEKHIRPLLVSRCHECHGDGKVKGGLHITSRAKLLEGGDTGPALVPGKPDQSLLIQAVRYPSDGLKMPPKGKLSDADIAKLTRWVEMGAPWPDAVVKPESGAASPFIITDEQRRYWAFQPVVRPPVPEIRNPKSEIRNPIDHFIRAKLDEAGLKPAPPVDKRTLIRRATFDLTGLPPTPEEVDDFLNDPSPSAFAKVVERLLASPAYGERWGRHWLDVVRYADSRDSRGMGGDTDITEAWRYRDWVIKAFNDDVPYDRFILNQIAGDRLPAAEPGDLNVDGLVATGLLTIGEWGTGDADKEKMVTDIVNDQIDVVTRSFLGLTVGCARCHDHKFDPISQKDYYGLAGIFFSTKILPGPGAKTAGSPLLRTPLLTKAEQTKRDAYAKRLKEVEEQLKQATERHYAKFAKGLLPRTADYVLAVWDYEHRPAEQATQGVEAFAAQKKLHPTLLKQWLDALSNEAYRPLTTPLANVGGKPGVHGWRGAADCPNAVINTTDAEVSILTFKLPPHTVSVHPGPTAGVAVAWQSPIDGKVSVAGRVVDADPVCGNGIAWKIEHRQGGQAHELTGGEYPNGGAQRFDEGTGATRLKQVEIKAGDRLELLVLPKGDYSCDTTIVELEIAEGDGARTWNLTADTLAAGTTNPQPDRQGHPEVWHFLDMGEPANRPKLDPTVGALRQSVLAQGDRGTAERSARAFADTFTRVDATNPFWITSTEAETLLPTTAREELSRLRRQCDELKKDPPGPVPTVLAAQDGGVPGGMFPGIQDVPIHVRGSYTRLGEKVPRHFPVVLAGEEQSRLPKDASGRLELAKWIANATNPLTARVMANRIWAWHFGEGIVRTPSNFGKLGERPTHAELLDYLADEFVKSGWSIKHLHRLIMSSPTYQQSSAGDAETLKKDPDNRIVGRWAPRRLEAEAIRDTLLAAAGKLDTTPGGMSFTDISTPRRTVYLRTIRSDKSGYQALFDAADPETPTEKRNVSTVAPQALFLLNHPFVTEQARAFARRMMGVKVSDEKERINQAYRILYGRDPTQKEVGLGLEFLTRYADSAVTLQAWEEYAQVLLCANELVYVE